MSFQWDKYFFKIFLPSPLLPCLTTLSLHEASLPISPKHQGHSQLRLLHCSVFFVFFFSLSQMFSHRVPHIGMACSLVSSKCLLKVHNLRVAHSDHPRLYQSSNSASLCYMVFARSIQLTHLSRFLFTVSVTVIALIVSGGEFVYLGMPRTLSWT